MMNAAFQTAEAGVLARESRMPAYDARELTDAGGMAALLLDGKVYTLRITKQGKLLLTK